MLDVTDAESLTVAIVGTWIAENDGVAATIATVTRSNTDTGAALTVTLTGGDATEIGIPASVVIPANASSISFDIEAVDDDLVDGTQTVTLTASTDGYVDGTDLLDVTDDDVAGFTISESGESIEVSESGTADTFTVALNVEPLSEVVIFVTSGDTEEAIVDDSSLTFTPETWDEPQAVNVAGVDDFVIDGDQTTTITLSVDSANSDGSFISLADQTIAVTTVDDGYHGWQNPGNSFDVNGHGGVTPEDVLTIINYLNAGGTFLPALSETPPPYYDVNDDGIVSPSDVLAIIAHMNNRPSEPSEGEAASLPVPILENEPPSSVDLADQLAGVSPLVKGRMPTGNETTASVWATARGGDDDETLTHAGRTREASADAVQDEAGLENTDAVFAEWDTLFHGDDWTTAASG